MITGNSLRDEGLQRTEDANREWAGMAYSAIFSLALRQPEVHVDDVLNIFHLNPKHHNAWGAVWMNAIRNGILAKSGQRRRTTDVRKHAHEYPIYRSLVYK